MIPYVISISNPDYKRPYLYQDFGFIEEDLKDTYFIDKVCEFILDRCHIETINDINDIIYFWDNYYDEYYMENLPWDARIFINNKWEQIKIDDKIIFEKINKIKNQENNTICLSSNDLSIIENINEEDTIIKMQNLFQETINKLKESSSESNSESLYNIDNLQHMDQLLLMLKTVTSYGKNDNKFQENSHLINNFIDIFLKYIQNDFESITEKLKIYDQNEVDNLINLMKFYDNIMEYKIFFNT